MIRSFKGKVPKIHPQAFVHPAAEVIGAVEISAWASVWPGCVLRGDADKIVIGERTNIQDGTIIHCDPGVPTILGRNITVGHRALLHGAVIADNVLIGMGSIVMAAKIGPWSLIGAGALILDGIKIPARSVVLGAPARVERLVGAKEIVMIRRGAAHYIERQKVHRRASLVVKTG